MEIISAYTRQQAIEDGQLVDLSDYTPEGESTPLIRQAGFKFPIAITQAAFEETIARGGTWQENEDGAEELNLPAGQDMTGRIWDILTMLKYAARKARGSELKTEVRVWDGKRQRVARIKGICGPGDHGEPVITVMLPHEV